MENRVIIKCPICQKRVLDIDSEFAVLYIKCKHCGKEQRIVWRSEKPA